MRRLHLGLGRGGVGWERVLSGALSNLRRARGGGNVSGTFFFEGVKRVFTLKSDQLLLFVGLCF